MLTRVLHTGIAVDDLDKAIQFYQNLGFSVHNKFEKPEPKAQVATVKNGDTAFELWHFQDKDHPQVAFIRNHVAVYSDDLETDVHELVQAGFKLVIPITEGVVLKYAFVQNPAGTCYEIATQK